MSLTRRRSDRPDPARRRLRSSLEALESRALLSGTSFHFYQPQYGDLPQRTVSPYVPVQTIGNVGGLSDSATQAIAGQGKIVQGTDRLGNQWSITVHGPGVAIVTDATPNDGVFDDDIGTIQLVGTDPNKTYVTGQTVASARVVTDGSVLFNKLISENGVKSIVLNGFILTETVNPPTGTLPNSDTGIFLPGGVGNLELRGVEAFVDQAASAQPINIIIGDPNFPLSYKPSVRIDEIFNTVFDSTATIPPNGPNQQPTVNIVINAEAHALQFISAGQLAVPAAQQYLFPIVGTTGRTSVQVRGVDVLRFTGGATNFTVARTSQPFQGTSSGVSHIGKADFGGNADGLALDSAGRIGGLRFTRGLGNPTGLANNPSAYGTPAASIGFAGSSLVGGLVSASSIGHVKVAPADVTLLTSSDASLIQQYRNGSTTYYPRAGHALNGAAIVTTGSIGKVTVTGDSQESEIKTGFNLASYNAGFVGTRSPSRIGLIKYRGDLINSVISASYRPGQNGGYGNKGSVPGPGSIRGQFVGSTYNTGDPTVLGNSGAGFFAAVKRGYLPPPQSGTRIVGHGKLNGLLIR